MDVEGTYFHQIEVQLWKLKDDFKLFEKDLTKHFGVDCDQTVPSPTTGTSNLPKPDGQVKSKSDLLDQVKNISAQFQYLTASVKEHLGAQTNSNGVALRRRSGSLYDSEDDNSGPAAVKGGSLQNLDYTSLYLRSGEVQRTGISSHDSDAYDSIFFARRSSSVGNLLPLPAKCSSSETLEPLDRRNTRKAERENHYVEVVGDEVAEDYWLPSLPSRHHIIQRQLSRSSTVPRSIGSLIRRPSDLDSPSDPALPKPRGCPPEYRNVSVADLTSPDMYGFLEKRVPGSSALKRTFKNTDKRWFVLKDSALYYFESQTSESPKNVISVQDYSIQPRKEWILLKPKQGCGRVFELKARSFEDRDRWVAQLQRAAKIKAPGLQELPDELSALYKDAAETPAKLDGSAAAGNSYRPAVPPRPPATLQDSPTYDAVGEYYQQ